MKFLYQARTKEGELKKGEIEASSREVAGAILRKYGLFPTSIKPAERISFKFLRFKRKVSNKEMSAFTSQLSVMLSSRISPPEALSAIASQIENEDFRKAILRISEMVERGSSLSSAFSHFPHYFNPFYISILKWGETTGKISECLAKLADHLATEYNLSSKIKGALAYPALVLSLALIVSFLVIFWIIPKFAELLGDIGRASFLTRFVIALSQFLKSWGIVLLLGILGIFFYLYLYFKSQKGKETLQKNSLKIPVLGNFYKKIYLSRFAESLSALISAGVPIAEALKVSAEVVGNVVYQKIILETRKKVIEGEKIHSVLINYPEYIPPFVSQLVKTGERTGRLEDTLKEIVNFYQKEVETASETFLSILQPILIIFVGLLVLFIGATVFSTLYGSLKTFY